MIHLLRDARANLWRAQQRFGAFPELYVGINNWYAFAFHNDKDYAYTLPEHPGKGEPDTWAKDHGKPVLLCYLDKAMLRRVLTREVHWNNLEIGCHIKFDRRPNVYMPDVHTLMSFFHVGASHG